MTNSKKIISVFLAVIIAFSVITIIPFTASAEDREIAAVGTVDKAYPDYNFFVDSYNKSAIISSYNGTGSETEVPAYLGGCKVTYLSNCLFSDHKELKKVVIPDTVIYIGTEAFESCTGLTEISIPDSVTDIGNGAFRGCIGLQNISIPDSVTSIGNNAFSGCTGLKSFTVPDSVTSIGSYAFLNCTGIKNIVIGKSVNTIGSSAFSGCSGITSITVPDSVTSTGDSLFRGCTRLQKVTLGKGLKSIGSSAFYRLERLTEIIIPDSVTSIGSQAFYGCTGLTSIVIPDSVTGISSNTFYNCTGLTNVIIGESVTSIDDSAFYNCTALTSVYIPDSVTSIGSQAFYGCTGLDILTISDSVTKIDERAFYNCKSLKSVKIPDSVTVIGNYAFGYEYNAYSGSYTKVEGFTICGFEDSEAEYYAEKNGFTFKPITKTGAAVKGRITSCLSDTEPVSVSLLKNGSVVNKTDLYGKYAYFTFENVNAGKYTLSISKKNHVTREFDLTVSAQDIKQNTTVNPIGDVNGDGKTTQTDYVTAMSYVRKTKDLNDYQIKCGDVFGTPDGKLTAQDANRIVQHTRKVKSLY